jgi:hypothetical protein
VLGLRIEPTTTTGRSSRTVRCRKYASSSSVSVPHETTSPPRSARDAKSALSRRASSRYCPIVRALLAVLENCSYSGVA